MKEKSIIALCAAIIVGAFAVSCASPPKAAPVPTPAPTPVPKVEESVPAPVDEAGAPNELRAKAAELRKKAFDFGLKDLLPEEYAAAEKAYAEGGAQYGKDNAASAASYTDAIARFQAVIKGGMPLLAASEKKKAEEQRKAAVAKKAGALFPSQMAFAEAEFEKPKAAEAAADYESAVAGYRASIKAYAILYRLCEANGVREYIASRDLAKWDSSNWNLAENKYKASRDLFRGDAKASGESADEAFLRYGTARDTALSYYAADRKKASETERGRAAGIKSEVAVKDEYAAALALYEKAEASQASKDYESSSSLYDKAASAFSSAYAHAKVKMDTAKGELESLDAAIAAKKAEALR